MQGGEGGDVQVGALTISHTSWPKAVDGPSVTALAALQRQGVGARTLAAAKDDRTVMPILAIHALQLVEGVWPEARAAARPPTTTLHLRSQPNARGPLPSWG